MNHEAERLITECLAALNDKYEALKQRVDKLGVCIVDTHNTKSSIYLNRSPVFAT